MILGTRVFGATHSDRVRVNASRFDLRRFGNSNLCSGLIFTDQTEKASTK